jgi:hypothetical protein
MGGAADDHHSFIIGLMETGELDWKSIDKWLRLNVESATFGATPHLTVPSRDEWTEREQRQHRIGEELNSPLTEEESDWLNGDVDD